MEKISTYAEVEKILPNEVRQLNKPGGKRERNLADGKKPKRPPIEWNIDKVGAPAVWDMGIDGSGTVVASIDTGVQWDHPALKEKYRGLILKTRIRLTMNSTGLMRQPARAHLMMIRDMERT